VPQLPTGTPMDSPTESSHPEAHACQRRGRSARLPMELPATLFPTDRKVRRDFRNFWCDYQFISAKNYRRNLMPPTTINCLLVIPSEKLVYKTPSLHLVHFFSRLSSLFLFSSPFEFSFWKRFYCFGGSFKHIRRYVIFFLYLCIFFIFLF
jgi:hypothetical protein